MSQSTRIEGNRVYCHVCEHEWDRAQGGLSCPNCESEFVEIVEHNTRPADDIPEPEAVPPPIPHTSRPDQPYPNPLHDHNPWSPDPDEDDITHFEFNTGGGRGTVSFTSRTYTFGGGRGSRDPVQAEIGHSFETMLGNIMGMHNTGRPTPMTGGMFGGFVTQPSRSVGITQTGPPQDLFSLLFPSVSNTTRQPNQPMDPFELVRQLISFRTNQFGDSVHTQEAFDRIVTQLMEENQGSGAPGPASEAAINSLKTKLVDRSMMGSDGKAECSICMDDVAIGDEVTVLPCNHWFHHECIVSWLKEHDTCPHCRKPISDAQETNQRSSPSRRRSSRRSSSVASPLRSASNPSRHESPVVDSPGGLREARQRYYGSRRDSDHHHRSSHSSHGRHSTSPRDRNSDGGGGVGGWIRNHMPFT